MALTEDNVSHGLRTSQSLRQIMRRVAAVQTAAGLCVALLTIAAFLLYRDASRESSDARADLVLTTAVQAEVLSAETGIRGFVLVGRRDFLDPYRRAIPRIERDLKALSETVEQEDQALVLQMGEVMVDWRQSFAEPILDRLRDRDRAGALAIVRSGRGKQRTDRFRRMVAELETRERDRIRDADARAESTAFVALAVLVGGAMAYFLSTALLRRQLQRRVIEPLRELTDTARRLGAGEFDARARPGGVEEMDLLSVTFNDMAARIANVVEELRSLDEMKTRFVSSVSHELRTPLTVIRGYTEMLLTGIAGDLNDEQRDYADTALRNASRLEDLINDLLMLSRLQSGRVKLTIERLDVVSSLRELVAGLEPVARERQLAIRIDAPETPLCVQADGLRIQQVFSNLLSNAIKFSRPNTVVVVAAQPQGDDVVVSVTDAGVGIPPDELPRLTERFFRASTAGHVEGTGLGLTITREIVERHGGALEIDSEVGVGSTFRVRLPARFSDDAAAAAGAQD